MWFLRSDPILMACREAGGFLLSHRGVYGTVHAIGVVQLILKCFVRASVLKSQFNTCSWLMVNLTKFNWKNNDTMLENEVPLFWVSDFCANKGPSIDNVCKNRAFLDRLPLYSSMNFSKRPLPPLVQTLFINSPRIKGALTSKPKVWPKILIAFFLSHK